MLVGADGQQRLADRADVRLMRDAQVREDDAAKARSQHGLRCLWISDKVGFARGRAVAAQLSAGDSPSPDAYAERDVLLHQLSDAALQQEYVRQTEAYLEPSTHPALRGIRLKACYWVKW